MPDNRVRPQVIVADENIPQVEHYFGGMGEIRRVPGRQLTAAQLHGADILLVRSVTRVDRQLLEGSGITFVGTCTIGTDHLDVDYLVSQGIRWANAPGCNANSVVEYVFAALASLEVPWWRSRVGVIGCGNVGGHLLRRLQALGVDCCGFDPLLATGHALPLGSLAQVLAADIVCVHAPLTLTGAHPSWHLLDESRLRSLRAGTVLISAGRGAVVDNQALKRVLADRPDLRVVLDVWEPEPELDTGLLTQVNLGTPHIAGYSQDGKVAGTRMVYEALCSHLGMAATVGPPQPDSVPCLHIAPDMREIAAEQLIWQVIRAAYDIAADDQRLREVAAVPANLATGFDGLRKNYPPRFEFGNWLINLPEAAKELEMTIGKEKKSPASVLATLGFALMQEGQQGSSLVR